MTRGRKPSENEQLETGLATVEDPYGLADLRTHTVDELLNAVRHEIRYAVVAMCRAGRLFMALKEKVSHGQWETFLDSQHIPRSYARGCMKIPELLVRYPKAVHLPPGKAAERLLRSSMSRIESILADLPEAAIKMLTPWDLADIYDKEKLKEKGPKNYKGPTDIELPSELDLLIPKAMSALRLIAECPITKKDYAQATTYAHMLHRALDRASYHLRDPEHLTTPVWELGNADDISEDS
jgi:hypothetical protein